MIPNEDSLRALYDRLFVRSANSPYAEDAPDEPYCADCGEALVSEEGDVCGACALKPRA
jgi:hypothetical protein